MVGQHQVKTPDEAKSWVRERIRAGDKSALLLIAQDGTAQFVAVKPAAQQSTPLASSSKSPTGQMSYEKPQGHEVRRLTLTDGV